MSLDRFLVTGKRKTRINSDDNEVVKKKQKLDDADEPKPSAPLTLCSKINDTDPLDMIAVKPDLRWRKVKAENLDCDYVQLFCNREAKRLLELCEKELDYNTGQLSKVQIFGKWHNIPRKQVAHGDPGLKYSFSGNTVPARPWTPLLTNVRNTISKLTGQEFNFVLINRYKDGHDHMGEHKDDEKDLVQGHPIASLSLGQPRDFVFKHQDARGKNATRQMAPVKLELANGSLLMMNHPTNTFWYHSLPQRKKLIGTRINMTFRKMVVGKT